MCWKDDYRRANQSGYIITSLQVGSGGTADYTPGRAMRWSITFTAAFLNPGAATDEGLGIRSLADNVAHEIFRLNAANPSKTLTLSEHGPVIRNPFRLANDTAATLFVLVTDTFLNNLEGLL